jgi:predicted flavoprotein YhiN
MGSWLCRSALGEALAGGYLLRACFAIGAAAGRGVVQLL